MQHGLCTQMSEGCILDESMDCFYVIYAVFALQEGDLFLNIMHQLGSRGM